MSAITSAIDREISTLEGKLSALRQAKRLLTGSKANGAAAQPRRKRRKLTTAQKAAISRRMKAAWKKRKAAKAH